MPTKCKRCGHVHWNEVPKLKETWETIKLADREYRKLQGLPLTFTYESVMETFNVNEAEARSRLKSLVILNKISVQDVENSTNGKTRYYRIDERVSND